MNRLISAATALLLAWSAHGASAQDFASRIVGTWQWAGHVYKEVATAGPPMSSASSRPG